MRNQSIALEVGTKDRDKRAVMVYIEGNDEDRIEHKTNEMYKILKEKWDELGYQDSGVLSITLDEYDIRYFKEDYKAAKKLVQKIK